MFFSHKKISKSAPTNSSAPFAPWAPRQDAIQRNVRSIYVYTCILYVQMCILNNTWFAKTSYRSRITFRDARQLVAAARRVGLDSSNWKS